MKNGKFILLASLISIALVASLSHIVFAVDISTAVDQPKKGIVDNVVSSIIAITAISYVASLYVQSRKQPNNNKNRG